VNAALVRTDLIGGLGEFEFSADSSWQMQTDTGEPWGTRPATPDYSVAAGWSSYTGYGVDPDQDAIFRIQSGTGLKGSNCQYMGLRRAGNPNGSLVYVKMSIMIDDSSPHAIHHGDTLTFRLDRVFMTGYTVPKDASVRYRMQMLCTKEPFRLAIVNDLSPTTTPFAAEVTSKVPAEAAAVTIRVDLIATGNLGSAVPGISFDGARLFVKRAGSSSYETEQVPAPRNRSINSQMVFFQARQDDPYAVARDFDAVMLQYESEYPSALRLRYYNPSIKVLLYEHGGIITDWRDQNLADPTYSNCPFAFGQVLAQHLDWLYPWPGGVCPVADTRYPWRRDADCCFMPDHQNYYFVHMESPSYQQAWRQTVADKVTRYRLDGVFIDSAENVGISPGIPLVRTPAEVQSFEHSVFPYMKSRSVPTCMNSAIGILSEAPASIYFDPFWKPNAAFPPSQGYESNSPQSTPDTFFQEWAFMKHYSVDGTVTNVYDIGYWNSTMENMETVAAWNKTLPSKNHKSMFALTNGVDRPGDPALGLDGWAHFGLCSFLLAQHEDAWFGAEYVATNGGAVNVDLSETSRLGSPASGRGMLASDTSLQMRLYKNGLVIVNGHPTQSRSYRIFPRVIDEEGNVYPKGLTVQLKPHTGRIFFYN